MWIKINEDLINLNHVEQICKTGKEGVCFYITLYFIYDSNVTYTFSTEHERDIVYANIFDYIRKNGNLRII